MSYISKTVSLGPRLTAWKNFNSSGILVQTSDATYISRNITSSSSAQIIVTNPDGVSGNINLALPQDIDLTSAVTFNGITNNSNGTVAGYLRVGTSTAATTAGDISCTRLAIGTSGLGASGEFLRGTGNMTSTASSSDIGYSMVSSVKPISASASQFNNIIGQMIFDCTVNISGQPLSCSQFNNVITNVGTGSGTAILEITAARYTGIVMSSTTLSYGDMTRISALRVTSMLASSMGVAGGTIGSAIGLYVTAPTRDAAGSFPVTVTGAAQILVDACTIGTNNTLCLLGTATIPNTGNYSIYAATSSYPSYFAGNVGIGNTSAQSALEVSAASDPTIRLSEASSTTSYLTITDVATNNARFAKFSASGISPLLDFDAVPADGTSVASVRFHRNSGTSGACSLQIFNGSSTGNCQIGGNTDTYLNQAFGLVAIGRSSPGAQLHIASISNALSRPSWTTSGVCLRVDAATYTNTTSAAGATVATQVTHGIAIPTFDATNALTAVTNAITLYIAGGPAAAGSGNSPITNSYALFCNAGFVRVTDNLCVGTPAAVSGVGLTIGGNRTTAAWGASGAGARISAATYTDSSTADSATVATVVNSSIAQMTVAATNASAGITYTDAASFYIANAPAAGSHITLTSAWAQWVDAGNCRFDGGLSIGSTVAPNAKVDILSTTEQLRILYDSSNYYKTTVSSTGGVTFDAVGSGSAFTFSDAVTHSSTTTLNDNITIADGKNIITNTTTGSIIAAATNQKLGFYGATPVVQQTDGATLTNNVTSGGTTNQIDNWTSLTVYATDAAAIRNAVYQLARKVKILTDALRALGLTS